MGNKELDRDERYSSVVVVDELMLWNRELKANEVLTRIRFTQHKLISSNKCTSKVEVALRHQYLREIKIGKLCNSGKVCCLLVY